MNKRQLKNPYRQIVFLLMVILVMTLTGCNERPKGPSVDDRVVQYLEALKSGDVELALGFYGEEFFTMIAKPQWRARLTELTSTYGPIIRYSLRNKQADTRFSGKFYIYIYDTVHQQADGKEKRVNHVFTFVRPVKNDSIVELIGHKITVK